MMFVSKSVQPASGAMRPTIEVEYTQAPERGARALSADAHKVVHTSPKTSPWTPPALTWARRLGHLAAESGHRTASAAWAVGDALLGKNPAFAHNAQTARAHHLARAAHHVNQAQIHGAVLHEGQLKTLGDLGNWLISSAARGLVPAVGVVAAARTYGLPGAAGALYALNTANYVEDQFHVAGQVHFKEAAIAGLLTTAIQVRAGAALPLAQGLARPALGATAAAGTSAGQSLNLAHLPVDADTQGASWWQRTVQGAFLATVFGPLFSLRPIPTSASTPPLLTQTHQGLLGSAPRLPGPAPNPASLPAHSITLPTALQRNGRTVPLLGMGPSKTYHWPQPHDDHRRLDLSATEAPRVSLPLDKIWASGQAGSPRSNALQHYQKHGHTQYSDVFEYSDAAYALANQPIGPHIRRLHTHEGATTTIDLDRHRLVIAAPTGKIATFHSTLNREQVPDGLGHWLRRAHANPPVGVRRATDYPLALTALDVQKRIWQAAGLPEDDIARHLLSIRGKVEWGRQLLRETTNPHPIREAVRQRKYNDLKQQGHSAQDIIDIALDTRGRHYPLAKPIEAPRIDWAATAQYPDGPTHLLAQWISHRYDLTEFKAVYDYLNAAHHLAQMPSSPTIQRQTLPDGGRLTLLDTQHPLLLLETPEGPHTLFRPPDAQAFWARVGNDSAALSTGEVARYAHVLSVLKAQADRRAVVLGSDLDRVAHTIARHTSASASEAAGRIHRNAYEPEGIHQLLALGTAQLPLLKTGAAEVARLYPSQLAVLDLMFQNVEPAAIAQRLNQSSTFVSNIIGKIYAHLGAARGPDGLAVFEHTHQGGLAGLYVDLKAAQKIKADNPRKRVLSDEPFDQSRLWTLSAPQRDMLKHLLEGNQPQIALDRGQASWRDMKFKLLRKLNVANAQQLSSYPGGLARLKQDLAQLNRLESQRDPWLKTLQSTRFELLYNYWTFGVDASTMAQVSGGRARTYVQYLEDIKNQLGITPSGQASAMPGGATGLSQALHIEKQARYVGYATMAQLLDQPHLVARAMAGIAVEGPFDPAVDIDRLLQRWGGQIKWTQDPARPYLYWQP